MSLREIAAGKVHFHRESAEVVREYIEEIGGSPAPMPR
jgi:hypothetical protein